TREAMEAELNNEKEILTQTEGIKSKRKRRILVPLKYSDNEDDENKTKERKKKNILSKKLQPFVSKRIVEYLDVQEDELVSFGIDYLRNKKSAEDLTKGMMMKLWCMLIFETESKTRKI
ncbi:hypothetical protein RhiirA5_360105, partial [Rhizophagus irregularis]